MSVKIKIFYPEVLRITGNRNPVLVTGKTVGECLQDLVRQYPGVENWIFDKQGKLLKQVFVHVNAESLHKFELSYPVKESDELVLVVLVTGG